MASWSVNSRSVNYFTRHSRLPLLCIGLFTTSLSIQTLFIFNFVRIQVFNNKVQIGNEIFSNYRQSSTKFSLLRKLIYIIQLIVRCRIETNEVN